MNIDKPCNNSSCEPTATGRRSKKSSRIAPMHTESLTDFLTFLLMQMDSKRICKRYRLRLVLDHESLESHEYIPCHDLQDSSDSCD